MAELVAGHSQDNEPLAGIAPVELVQLGVIPGGRTSERRDVLNEDDFAPQGGEMKGFPRQQVGRKVVEFRGHRGACAVVWTRCFPPNFLRSLPLGFPRPNLLRCIYLSRWFTPRTLPCGMGYVDVTGKAQY